MELEKSDTALFPTDFWHTLEDGRIQCDVCPRYCKLREGQRGLCFVRARDNNQVVLTTYGRSSGFCIDPIEKKPLNHFLPGTPTLSFGTAGCNLSCKFCQNWDMSKSKEMDILADSASPEKIAEVAQKTGARSVAFTYNDPVIFLEYATDTAKACHEHDIKTVAVTAGYIAEGAREAFFQHIDAANIDLKSFTEDFYWKLTGGHLDDVLETLKYLKHQTDVWFELTTLMIPGKNDSEAEIREMSAWVVNELGTDVPMHFSAFHPDFKMTNIGSTPVDTLMRARDIAIQGGVEYVYVGNISDRTSNSTWCPKCGYLLIERLSYTLGKWGITNKNSCEKCDHPIAGVFEVEPGNWGARRTAIRIGG
ncbi:MAG: AmmeMemoRadiSam system radical SAM enzyme [Proteobacteria bacterium]|nr:AmmeMemoRadiSam system radical SAM enzyme [Pseudomonadota bacterium]